MSSADITNGGNDPHVVTVHPERPDRQKFQYAFAASPDVIRANQKDVYFQGVLADHVATLLRRLAGARTAHSWSSEAFVFSELLYLGLTTLLGNRTLGEEYCDVVQVEDDTLQLPSVLRRGGYILSSVLTPYILSRVLPLFKRRLRNKMEANLRQSSTKAATTNTPPTLGHRIQSYLLPNLDTLTSPETIYAASLAVFYFSGAYYHLGKRLWRLRYIFTRQVAPSDQRAGYEVLGLLLVLQLGVQTWLHVKQHLTLPTTQHAGHQHLHHFSPGSAMLEGGIEVSLDANAYTPNHALLLPTGTPLMNIDQQGLAKTTHTPALEAPRYDLADEGTLPWLPTPQQRKCTLCLEPMKDPSVTTCGHLFCWTCIADWAREKPECPLCRQTCLPQHILPLRG